MKLDTNKTSKTNADNDDSLPKNDENCNNTQNANETPKKSSPQNHEAYQRVSQERDSYNSLLKERLQHCMEFLKFDEKDGLNNLNWNAMTMSDQRQLLELFMSTAFPALTPDLVNIMTGTFYYGDCGRQPNDKPDWLDMDKFLRGQKFARDHYFGINFAQLLSLFTLFSFDHGLKTLIITEKSSTPFTSFKRYLSTGTRVRNWYTENPWQPGTAAYNDIQTVRKLHSLIRSRLAATPANEINEAAKIKNPMASTREMLMDDMQAACPAPGLGQCPYLKLNNLAELGLQGLNQGEMSITQFGFFGLVLLYPNAFGIYNATEEDFEAFCHTWKGLGYLLGIDDEYNFCRGTLDEIRQRCKDFLHLWVKPNFRSITPEFEHMMRCVVEGLQYYFPGSSYETCFLYLTELMDVNMPRLYNSLSYFAWIKYLLLKSFFYYTIKIPGLYDLMNKRLDVKTKQALEFDPKKLANLEEKSNETLKKKCINDERYTDFSSTNNCTNYNQIVVHHL